MSLLVVSLNFKCELFAKPSKIGIMSPPHQDNYYWCLKNGKSLTFWIALDKSNKKMELCIIMMVHIMRD